MATVSMYRAVAFGLVAHRYSAILPRGRWKKYSLKVRQLLTIRQDPKCELTDCTLSSLPDSDHSVEHARICRYRYYRLVYSGRVGISLSTIRLGSRKVFGRTRRAAVCSWTTASGTTAHGAPTATPAGTNRRHDRKTDKTKEHENRDGPKHAHGSLLAEKIQVWFSSGLLDR